MYTGHSSVCKVTELQYFIRELCIETVDGTENYLNLLAA